MTFYMGLAIAIRKKVPLTLEWWHLGYFGSFFFLISSNRNKNRIPTIRSQISCVVKTVTVEVNTTACGKNQDMHRYSLTMYSPCWLTGFHALWRQSSDHRQWREFYVPMRYWYPVSIQQHIFHHYLACKYLRWLKLRDVWGLEWTVVGSY